MSEPKDMPKKAFLSPEDVLAKIQQIHEHMQAHTQQLGEMMAAHTAAIHAAATAPRRVVRDPQTGRVIGTETVQDNTQ